MSGRRSSGRKRKKHDLYETPAWVVTECLAPFFSVRGKLIGEHAVGNGKLALGLVEAGAHIVCADIVDRKKLPPELACAFRKADFLSDEGFKLWLGGLAIDGLVTNPPWGEGGALAFQFIEQGLRLLREPGGPKWMALLLGIDYDLAASRVHLFERCPEYHGTIRLRRRIEWFKRKRDRSGKLSAGPSQHHAWYIWTRPGREPNELPVTRYAPSTGTIL